MYENIYIKLSKKNTIKTFATKAVIGYNNFMVANGLEWCVEFK